MNQTVSTTADWGDECATLIKTIESSAESPPTRLCGTCPMKSHDHALLNGNSSHINVGSISSRGTRPMRVSQRRSSREEFTRVSQAKPPRHRGTEQRLPSREDGGTPASVPLFVSAPSLSLPTSATGIPRTGNYRRRGDVDVPVLRGNRGGYAACDSFIEPRQPVSRTGIRSEQSELNPSGSSAIPQETTYT